MAKSFYTQGTGSAQTLNDSQDEKIPVYATKALAQADLANLAEGQIIATKDGTADTQTLKDYVNFRYWDNESQDADANTLTAPGVYSVHATDPTTQHLDVIETNGWCVIYVTRVDSNPDYVQQQLVDWFGHKWTRRSQAGIWSSWLSDFNYDSDNAGTVNANVLTTPGVYSIYTPAGSESQNNVPHVGWGVIYISRFDNNPNAVQQVYIDYEQGVWLRLGSSPWNEWKKIPRIDEVCNMSILSYWSNDANNPIYVLATFDNLDTSYGLQHAAERHIVARIGGETDQSPSGRANTDFVYYIDTLSDKAWMHVTAYDIRTNNIFSIEKNLGTWGQWENVNVSLNSSTPVPAGTSFSNAFTALTWHLGQVDFSQLTAYNNITLSGKFELQGYYWGNFTATHFGSGYIGVHGEINYGGQPCSFSAFRDVAIGTWKVGINGEYLLYDANGWLVTTNNGGAIGQANVIKVRGNGTAFSYMNMTDTIGKTGVTLRGSLSFTPNVNTTWTFNGKHDNNSRPETQPAGNSWGMENVAITSPDSANQSWIITGEDRFTNVYANLWGNDWTQSYISASGEFIG